MNFNQQEIIDGFRYWDPSRMTDGFCGLLRDILEFNEVPNLAEQIRPQVVDLLAGFLRHPKRGSFLTVNGENCGLWIYFNYKKIDSTDAVAEIWLSLDDILMRSFGGLWLELGYSSDVVVISRTDLHPPISLKWEPGWSVESIDAWVKAHAIRRSIRAEDTYEYARTQQATGANSWLTRYVGGECQVVWNEMAEIGKEIRSSDCVGEAYAVAKETMRRCRQNLLILENSLPRLGYRFRKNRRIAPPSMLVHQQISKLEKQVGPLPLALCAWFEHVGSVDFTGELTQVFDMVNSHSLDPIAIWPSNIALRYDQSKNRGGFYRILVASDQFMKDGAGGGAAYQMQVPNASVDGEFLNEWHHTTFMNYLRTCFLSAGLPGLDVQRLPLQHRTILNEIVSSLLPI